MATQEHDTIAYLNGNWAPLSQSLVPINTHALQYGTGCFEGIRGYWDGQQVNVLFLREHCERLAANASMLMMKSPSVDEMCEIALETIRKNAISSNCYLRPMVYKGSFELGPDMVKPEDHYMCYVMPLGDYLDTSKGLEVCVSSWRRLGDNAIPSRAKATGGYINSSLAKTEAMLNGYDEALVLNEAGFVAEGSAENIFLVRDGVLVTPDKTAGILEGITRQTIIELAVELGYRVEERQVGRTELYRAHECFLVGTGCQVSWVKTIDRRIIGNGERGAVSTALQSAYEDGVYGRDASKKTWLSPVQ